MPHYNPNLRDFSRELRKSMTDAEKLLWSRIRRKQVNGFQFYRQKVIGTYIVDFYCAEAKLVIELDGGQHYSEEGMAKDQVRDNFMESLGLKVLRVSDREIFENIKGVTEAIEELLK